ncbi:hypothetical protein [Azospirillum sp. B2RO_4]
MPRLMRSSAGFSWASSGVLPRPWTISQASAAKRLVVRPSGVKIAAGIRR